jgi:hypothetical protein
MSKISKRQQRLQSKGIKSSYTFSTSAGYGRTHNATIILKENMDSRFTLEENRLLANLSIPNSTEQWKGITIKNEEIALLDYFYGVNAMKMYDKAKLVIGMLYKCNPKLVDLILE